MTPAVATAYSSLQQTPGGRLAQAIAMADTATGASVALPASAAVFTRATDSDTDRDGMADQFRVTLCAMQTEAGSNPLASLDEGLTTSRQSFIGGMCCLPADAVLDQDATLAIPLHQASGIGAGRVVWIWRYAGTIADTSPSSGAYWQFDGIAQTELRSGQVVAPYQTRRLGNYALSAPLFENCPPLARYITANPAATKPGLPVQLTCLASDPDGDTVLFQWSGMGNFTAATSAATNWTAAGEGLYELRCQVKDMAGRRMSRTVFVRVQEHQPNAAPVIETLTADPLQLYADETTLLSCTASDAEGDELHYSWSGPGVFDSPQASSTLWHPASAGEASLSCLVTDSAGGSASRAVYVTVLANAAPVIDDITADPQSILVNSATQLNCLAHDPESDVLSFHWTGLGSFSATDAAAVQWTIDTPGDYTLTCSVADTHGNEVAQQVTVTVTPGGNQPPVIEKVTADPTTAATGALVQLSCQAADPDGDTLEYSWSGEGIFASQSAAQTSWLNPAAGVWKLTCTVSDGHGHSVEGSTDVQLVAAGDVNPPLWPTGGPQFSVQPFEGYVLAQWSSATDLESPPAQYVVYYAEYSGTDLDPLQAQHVWFDSIPAMPVKIDGLSLGQTYQFALAAVDSSPQLNSTALVRTTATPRPYYGTAPETEVEMGAVVRFASMASLQEGLANLCVVWAQPDSGKLSEAHYNGTEWIEREVVVQGLPARHYVIPEVCFFAGTPVIVAADDMGHLDLLRQRLDGTWDGLQIAAVADSYHTGLAMVTDPQSPHLYVAHALAHIGLAEQEWISYLDLDMFAGGNPVAAQFDGQDTADRIGELQARIAANGRPTFTYLAGSLSWADPAACMAELRLTEYDPLLQMFGESSVPGISPIAYDIRPGAFAGWQVLAVQPNAKEFNEQAFTGLDIIKLDSVGGPWTAPTIVVNGTYLVTETTTQYLMPVECQMAPDASRFYYTTVFGNFSPAWQIATADMQLWSGPLPINESGGPRANLHALLTGNLTWLLGTDAPALDFGALTDQLHYAEGPLKLRVF